MNCFWLFFSWLNVKNVVLTFPDHDELNPELQWDQPQLYLSVGLVLHWLALDTRLLHHRHHLHSRQFSRYLDCHRLVGKFWNWILNLCRYCIHSYSAFNWTFFFHTIFRFKKLNFDKSFNHLIYFYSEAWDLNWVKYKICLQNTLSCCCVVSSVLCS